MRLSIVIPAHNEQDVLGSTISALHTALKENDIQHEIIVVNDNSHDDTKTILISLAQTIRELRFINNPPPRGFGYAVRNGLNQTEGDVVAIVMADGSDLPDDVVRFYREMEKGYECVFGSRFIKGSNVVDYPWLKLLINRLANLFIRLVFGYSYNDTTNAFKMYRKNVISGLQPLLSAHFNLTVEMPLKAIIRGYKYTVIPNTWINRQAGKSKLNLQEMGSRYLFIVLYCFFEKWLSKGDYLRKY